MSNRQLVLSYLAGIIDGEGCIGVYKNRSNGNHQLRITVEMVEEHALILLHEVFGGKCYRKKAKRPRRARRLWMVFNSQAASALIELRPYLQVKRKHADVALEANWIPSTRFVSLSIEENETRTRVNAAIKKMNKRGYYGE
jgi:hypothetical protein